jgi:hypothetical protein
MKNPLAIFRGNEDVQAAERALAQTEERINALLAQRAAMLAEAEYEAAVFKLDQEVSGLRAKATLHAERVSTIQERQRKLDHDRLEQEKTAGIAEHAKRRAKIVEAAKKADALKAQYTAAISEVFKAYEDAEANYPAALSPLGRLRHFSVDAIEALSAQRRPRPPSVGPARHFAELDPFNLADAIETQNRACIEMLESAPIAEDAAA